jgi:hypothetical protein
MRKVLASCLLIAVFAGMGFAQVNLCGKVTDAAGNPLTNTIVRLGQTTYDNGFGQNAYITKTDNTGYYHLGIGTCTTPVFKEDKVVRSGAFSMPYYIGGQVLFSLPQDNLQVTIGLYDLAGRFVKELMNSRLSKGNYGVRVDTRAMSSQYYLVRVTVNGVSSVFKLQPLTRVQSATVAQNVPAFQTKLEKLAAVVDTLHATQPFYSIGVTPIEALTGQYNFTMTKTTTYNGDTAAFWGNTASYPTNTSYVILNRTNGAFADSQIYWSLQQGGTKVRLSDQPTFPMSNITSGRLYLWVAPKDSNNRYFDFIELNGSSSWNGNTTQVDGWRLPITFRIHSSTGSECILGSSYEMFYQTRQAHYDEYLNEVPKEFTRLGTQNFANIYAMHTPPVNLFNTNGPYVDYFSKYEDTVLAHNPGQAKANANQISACAGGMGSQPSYCSAVNRHCGHLPQTEWRNSANYYLAPPCNYYSNWVHRRSLNAKAYGFPYDDYAEQAAFCGRSNIQWLAIAVGW